MAEIQAFQDSGDIQILWYFFADHVFETAYPARCEGGTRAWHHIYKKIKDINATNVVIMTDDDLYRQAQYTMPVHWVEGCVWWIWKGTGSPELSRELKGTQGNFQYKLR